MVDITCEVQSIVQGSQPHTLHTGQEASSQAPGAGPWDQQLRGVQIVTITRASSHQQHLS